MKIKNIKINQILNSKNENTVELIVNDKFKASSGGDGDLNKNISENPGEDINFLSKILNKGMYNFDISTFKDILEIEEILLGYDKSNKLAKLGGNVLLSLEFALLKLINNQPYKIFNKHPDKLPLNMCNCAVVNYDEKRQIKQEIILIPNTTKFSEGFFANTYIYRKLGSLFKTNEKNDEGSFIINSKIEDSFFQLEKLTNEVTKKLGIDFSFGLNLDAQSIIKNNIYKLGKNNFTINEHLSYINKLINRFDISYLEDPLNRENVNSISKLKTEYLAGNKIFNNMQNLKKYARHFNCAVIKINEIGSLGKLKKIIDFCKNNDISTVLSQATGDTNETVISDIAVGFEFDFIKYCAYGKERISKLNRIKSIETEFS